MGHCKEEVISLAVEAFSLIYRILPCAFFPSHLKALYRGMEIFHGSSPVHLEGKGGVGQIESDVRVSF